MAKQDYSGKLKDPRWQKRRLKTFERDNWCCQLCGDDKTTLNIHHKKYGKEPWDVPDSYLITLCEHCHLEVEMLNEEFDKQFLFKDIKIYKSSIIASDETRTMFISVGGLIKTRTCTESGNTITESYIFNEDLKKLEKLILHAMKNLKPFSAKTPDSSKVKF